MKTSHYLGVASVALAGVVLLGPGLASAHSNHVRATCDIGVNVEAHDYPATPAGASSSVTVEFDGQVALQLLFGPAVKANAANPDKSVPHSYRVTFDRFDYVGPDGDREYVGSIPACAPATTSTTVVAVDVPPVPSTTGPAIECVLGPDGHYSFAGTDIPCEGPAPTTTIVPALAIDVPTTSVPCQEDQPCWDCATMGNRICGPSAPAPSGGLPQTGEKETLATWALVLVLVGGVACLVAVRRRRCAP